MENNTQPATALVIFGVTGDLTFRKLIPAIYQLTKSGQMNHNLYIYGFARRDWDQPKLLSIIRESINEEFPNDKDADSIIEKFNNKIE